MDIKQLECFVAVAEELHFRKAGERIGLSQSALSERVSALENELMVRLFFRTTRQVSLTQAGSEFLKDAKQILLDIEKSVSNIRHTAETGLQNIRVSGVDEAISILMPRVLLEFQKLDPKTHIQMLEIASSEQHTQELIAHRTDVAFVRKPCNDKFITSVQLNSQRVMIAMSSNDPLASAPCLSASDIIDQPIVGYPKHARPILHDILWSSFRNMGAQPKIVCEVIDKSTLLQFVSHGLGIAMVPAWVKSIASPDVVFVPFETSSRPLELHVAFRKAGNSNSLDRFVEIVKSAALPD
ncbi:MAG: LysR family transcriptional regulator [Nitratireductor sp.]